jgi:hypothetical protein
MMIGLAGVFIPVLPGVPVIGLIIGIFIWVVLF